MGSNTTAVRGTGGVAAFMESNTELVTGRDLVKGGGATGLPFASLNSKDLGHGGYGLMGDFMSTEQAVIFSGAHAPAAATNERQPHRARTSAHVVSPSAQAVLCELCTTQSALTG